MAITVTTQKKPLKIRKNDEEPLAAAAVGPLGTSGASAIVKVKGPHYATFTIFGILAFFVMVAVIVTEIKELNFYVAPPDLPEFPTLTKSVVPQDGIDATTPIQVSPWVAGSGIDALVGRYLVAGHKWGWDAVWASLAAWPVLLWFLLALGLMLKKAGINAYSILLPVYNVLCFGKMVKNSIVWSVVLMVPVLIGSLFLLPFLMIPFHLPIWVMANTPGVASDGGFLIKFYDLLLLPKLAGYPLWWFGLAFFLISGIIAALPASERFGKGVGFAIAYMVLPFICVPILGFGGSEYTPPPEPVAPPPKPKPEPKKPAPAPEVKAAPAAAGESPSGEISATAPDAAAATETATPAPKTVAAPTATASKPGAVAPGAKLGVGPRTIAGPRPGIGPRPGMGPRTGIGPKGPLGKGPIGKGPIGKGPIGKPSTLKGAVGSTPTLPKPPSAPTTPPAATPPPATPPNPAPDVQPPT